MATKVRRHADCTKQTRRLRIPIRNESAPGGCGAEGRGAGAGHVPGYGPRASILRRQVSRRAAEDWCHILNRFNSLRLRFVFRLDSVTGAWPYYTIFASSPSNYYDENN
ncbi:hypothetical protein EVAR_66893_1 [Eumeta japonica]|uniref:Uncharacterized protein n=1 Tax=Eumeta variegata TaxID=151549 RepID=A0A4C2AFF1_EUMVA|nr:hypothetical protein EVAR_66893_1 [Eumeta japonica]